MMTNREAELKERLARSHARLVRSTEALAERFNARLDPFESVRQSPVGSLLTVAATAALVGSVGSALFDRRRQRADGGGGSVASPLGTLLGFLGPTLVPMLMDFLTR